MSGKGQQGNLIFLLAVLFLFAAPARLLAEQPLPIIDAHSQLEHEVAPEQIIRLMDQAQVSRTILAARRKTTITDMIALARKYPDRITAAVRTKGAAYRDKPVGAFKKFLAKQTKHPNSPPLPSAHIPRAQDRQERQDHCSRGGVPARQ